MTGKYNQAELQSDLNYAHRVNKAIEWVLKEKSKEADNTIADKSNQAELQSDLNYAHRVNKAIEWVS